MVAPRSLPSARPSSCEGRSPSRARRRRARTGSVLKSITARYGYARVSVHSGSDQAAKLGVTPQGTCTKRLYCGAVRVLIPPIAAHQPVVAIVQATRIRIVSVHRRPKAVHADRRCVIALSTLGAGHQVPAARLRPPRGRIPAATARAGRRAGMPAASRGSHRRSPVGARDHDRAAPRSRWDRQARQLAPRRLH